MAEGDRIKNGRGFGGCESKQAVGEGKDHVCRYVIYLGLLLLFVDALAPAPPSLTIHVTYFTCPHHLRILVFMFTGKLAVMLATSGRGRVLEEGVGGTYAVS